jgi:hypothetical protein
VAIHGLGYRIDPTTPIHRRRLLKPQNNGPPARDLKGQVTSPTLSSRPSPLTCSTPNQDWQLPVGRAEAASIQQRGIEGGTGSRVGSSHLAGRHLLDPAETEGVTGRVGIDLKTVRLVILGCSQPP